MAMSFLSHPDRKLPEQWLRSAKASPISRKVTGSHGAALDLMKLASLGSLYVTRPILRDYTLTRAELLDRAAEVFQAVVSGTLKLRMERTYSLGEATQAHRDLESRETTGKLLLLP